MRAAILHSIETNRDAGVDVLRIVPSDRPVCSKPKRG